MPVSFGQTLAAAIKAAGLTKRGFVRAAKYDNGSVIAVLRGKRNPPRDKATTWADALGLAGAARDSFIESYVIAVSPPEVADLIARLRTELERARRRR